MGLSKKLLFGLVGGIGATTVVVGTAVGISINQKQSASFDDEKTNNGLENTNSNNFENTSQTNPVTSKIDLTKVAKKLLENKELIEIKKLKEDGNTIENISLMHQDLYAFNVVNNQLSIKQNTLENNVQATLKLNTLKNTAAYLNSGKLAVNIELKQTNNLDNIHVFEVELNGFKQSKTSDFGEIFSKDKEDEFVIAIDHSQDLKKARWVDLEILNNQKINYIPTLTSSALTSSTTNIIPKRNTRNSITPTHIRRDEIENDFGEAKSKMLNGLTIWLYDDQKKNAEKNKLEIQGQVKLAKLSFEQNKTYFHLVSKDKNSHLKLVKNEEGDNKEIAISQIKTTNILPSDVSVIPKEFDLKKTKAYLEQLKNLNTNEDSKSKYLVDKQDESLNRYLSVNLSGMINTISENRLFIKPYVINWPENNTISFSITVSFGENDYATSFSTTDVNQLNLLKEAGFKFNLFTKKFDGNDDVIEANKFKTAPLKTAIDKVFNEDNYYDPSAAPKLDNPKFETSNFDIANSSSSLSISLIPNNHQLVNSQNWIAFVSYSYKGMEQEKVLFRPNLSLIRVESKTPVA